MSVFRLYSKLLKDLCKTQQFLTPFSSNTIRETSKGLLKFSTRVEGVIRSRYSDVIIPKITYTEYLYNNFDKYAKRQCIVNGDTQETFTYEETLNKANSLASALSRLGVTKGDIAAIVSPNCPEFFFSFLALSLIGAVSTTVNTSYTPDEIRGQLSDSKPTTIITHSLLLNKVREACEDLPSVRYFILIDGEANGFIPMRRLFSDDGKGIPNVHIDPVNDVLTLPYSSGTTGIPKGVMLTHSNVISNIVQYMHPDLTTRMENEVFMGILPFFHIYGMVALMSAAACTGSKLITFNQFDPVQFLASLKQYQPTVLHTVPPILSFLTISKAPPDLLSNTHTVICGAAPAGPTLVERFLSKFGNLHFQEGFGMTETSPLTHITPQTGYIMGSCGTAIPNTLTKLVDVFTGEIIDPKLGTGELCVKGPQVMKGYFNNEAATRETVDEDGWLRTGDIARIDDDDNVYIVDRLKELIKVKGLQVAPAELEDLLRKHPMVQDAAVVGVIDERTGEIPKAYVVLAQDAKVQPEEIEEFVGSKVAAHKKLAGGVVFIDKIPRSDTGKVLRRKLK